MLLVASIAAAHSDLTPHVHEPSVAGLLVLGAWIAAALVLWRKLA